VTAENFREVETEFNLQLYHVFVDLRKLRLEVSLLQKENKKMMDANLTMQDGTKREELAGTPAITEQ
jgi:hypothetical protein